MSMDMKVGSNLSPAWTSPQLGQGSATAYQSAQFDQAKSFSQELNQAMGAQKTTADDKKLKQTCQDMESVFLNMMLQTMRKTVPKDSLIGESNEDDIVKSMMDDEMAKNLSKAGGIGLADMLYKQLSPQHQQVTKK